MTPRSKKTSGSGSGDPARDTAVQAVVDQIMSSGNPQAAFAQFMRAAVDFSPMGLASTREGIDLPDPPATPLLLTVRLDLGSSKPPIWRRLELRGDLTLDRVHDVIQVSMGWTDSHLHRFSAPGKGAWSRRYFVTNIDEFEGDDGTREVDVRLDQVLRASGDTLVYVYDFGDSWEHRLKVEAVRDATDDDPPARCLKGRRACPPEDVGGIHMWNELAETLEANPDPRSLTGELEMYAEWLPPDVDPAAFDVAEVNAALAPTALDERRQLAEAMSGLAWGAGFSFEGLRPEVEAALARYRGPLEPTLVEWCQRAAEAPKPTPAELAEVLHPWKVVLETAGADGIPLTKAGWMAPTACERLWHASGLAWDFGKGNREQHTPELMMLREEATRAKLIRKHKDRLVLTPTGRTCRGDDEALADAVVASIIGHHEQIDREASIALMLPLAGGWTPQDLVDDRPWPADFQLRDEVKRILTGMGWQHDDGSPLLSLPHRVSTLLSLVNAYRPEPAKAREVPAGPGVRWLARRVLFED